MQTWALVAILVFLCLILVSIVRLTHSVEQLRDELREAQGELSVEVELEPDEDEEPFYARRM